MHAELLSAVLNRVARVVLGAVVVIRECDGRSETRRVSPCERETVLGGVEQCAQESHSGVFWGLCDIVQGESALRARLTPCVAIESAT